MGSFVSPVNHTHTYPPCLQHPSPQDRDHDHDHGGISLTQAVSELSPELHTELAQDGCNHSSFCLHRAGPSWTTGLTDGGVCLSTNVDVEPRICEDTSTGGEWIDDTSIASIRLAVPGPQTPIDVYGTGPDVFPPPHHPVLIDQDAHPFVEAHSQNLNIVPTSPNGISSTRWQDTEATQTAYELRTPQETHFDTHEWVDYDVFDFLNRWKFHGDNMGEVGLIHNSPERMRQWLPPFPGLRSRVRQEYRDIQGLDWSALGTKRSKARTARKMLYPLANSWNSTAGVQYNDFGHGQQRLYACKQFFPQHLARYSHGQLRHVLAARGRNDIFYAARNKVMRASLSCPHNTEAIIDLAGASSANPTRTAGDCMITTLAVSPLTDFEGYLSDAILVAGGYGGEYALLNLNSDTDEPAVEGYVTHAHESITTHVHTLSHRRTGALGAAFCSNDRKLRLLDVTTNAWTSEVEYANEINCAVTSPDGRLRAIVGDMCETLITEADGGNVLFSMRQHTSYGFACAWSSDGRHVATGSEDGKVAVYDTRRWDTPLTMLSCDMSCARSLHFTTSNPSGNQALVVAETEDIVKIYDTSDWGHRQTIEFFGSIVGAASVDDGRELLIANGDRTVGGLMVFERQEEDVEGEDEDDLESQQQEVQRGKKRSIGYEDGMDDHHRKIGRFDVDDL